MAEVKNRWRKVKRGNVGHKYASTQIQQVNLSYNLKTKLIVMCASERIKAFITDMFMIHMPLLYMTTYVFMDGKESFTHNQWAIFVCGALYGVISSLFFTFSSQTPGYRYMKIKLVGENDSKIGFMRALIRYVLWLVGVSLLVGFVVALVRKDSRWLHDVVCKTKVVRVEEMENKTIG